MEKKRTPGNDARTDAEKKDEEISGSIFDPEKGAALPEEGVGRVGVEGTEEKSEKKEACALGEPEAAL